ncbi:MAG: four helix bundle protein [Muribaculaceae bacterium]|nr:four helix bundle protein [Muribaculaceae bacterium]
MDIKSKKAEEFSLRIIKLHSYLKEKGEYVMSKQILRAGTSIGANIAESIYSESTDDLIHKLHISTKEASETSYWLRLLYRSEFIDEKLYLSLQNDCQELIKILTSIINKLKSTRK